MPSTTRGSILISTANDIGEALVEKLGGVGYSPNEWKEKYNLCGIAPVDSAPALSVLADSAGTGDERGSILIATADAIGAILNKKYNVLRGFKPKEWASACRKMKALEEVSVASASIASFSDGADDVPTKSLIVTIPPTLSGVSSVTETQTGSNVWDEVWELGAINVTNGQNVANNNFIRSTNYIPVLPNTVYYKCAPQNYLQLYYGKDKSYLSYGSWNKNTTFTTPSDCYFVRFYVASEYGTTYNNDIALNYPPTFTEYAHYNGTTYTASLGRTIYGGTADIVNGEGQETHQEIDLGSLTWVYASVSNRFYANLHLSGIYTNFPTNTNELADITCADYETITFSSLSGDSSLNNKVAGVTTDAPFLTIRDTRFSNATDFKNAVTGKKAVIPLATPEDFTFDGQEINTRLGYNAFWSDSGNTAVEYYQAPTPYARKTATGGIANFSDQRTDLPLTEAIANIAPSIAGKSAVNLYQGKKNLLKLSDGEFNIVNTGATVTISNGVLTVSGTTINSGGRTTRLSDYFIIKAGTYFLSPVIGTSPYVRSYLNKKSDNSVVGYSSGYSFTVTEETEVYFGVNLENGYTYDVTLTPQLEVGSSASAYEQYQDPTTYTAELGETVYGGSVDFVSGEVQKTFALIDLGSLTYTSRSNVGMQSNGVSSLIQNPPDNYTKTTAVASDYTADTWQAVVNGGTSSGLFGVSGGYICFSTTETDPAAFKSSMSGKYLVYPLATPTESTIPGRVISPIEGVNNYWNDAGGDTEIQYFENEA